MLDPLVKTIEVPCSQEKAFGIFVNEMSSWWPLDKFTVSAMGGNPAKSIRVEAKTGGEIVEIGHDGTETPWGSIISYDPHGFLSMDFHIPGPPDFSTEPKTLVEVRFTSLGAEQTRVELTQSNWEGLGADAEVDPIRGGYDYGWALIFEQGFKTACGG